MTKRYHELINKTDLTKEEKRELEQLKKLAHKNGFEQAIKNIAKLENVNILSYNTVDGLYRIQTKINGKDKSIARVKIAKKDVYILIRETTARAINKEYEIINYNLPAGFHETTATDLYNVLVDIIEYHNKTQTA